MIGGMLIGKSDRIGVPHAFSTRLGGVSTLPHLASLNLGENRGDTEENVSENINRLLALLGHGPLGFDLAHAVRATQTHSLNVRTVTSADGGRKFEDTDGFVTADPGVALIVKIADCVPMLLWDPEAHVIGALHGGWKGSGGKIAAVGVEKMTGLGSDPGRIRVAIGPCIHDCCYEVQKDFVDAMTGLVGNSLAEVCISTRGGKYYADLPGLNKRILLLCGVREENIDISPACTCCRPDRYFSHRASGGLRGTMGAAIAL